MVINHYKSHKIYGGMKIKNPDPKPPSPEERQMLDSVERDNEARKQELAKRELEDEELKQIVIKGIAEKKNVNQIWKAHFPKDRKDIRSKMYRIFDKVKAAQQKQIDKSGKKTTATPQIAAAPFQPQVTILPDKEVPMQPAGPAAITPEAQPEAYRLVTTEEAKYLSYHMPNNLLKLIDPRIELSPDLENDGAILHRDVMNSHPSAANKYLPWIAVAFYWVRVGIESIVQLVKFRAEDRVKSSKSIKKQETEIRKDIAKLGGAKSKSTHDIPDIDDALATPEEPETLKAD